MNDDPQETRPASTSGTNARESTDKRVEPVFQEHWAKVLTRTGRLLANLMVVEWIVAIAFAYWFSPRAWAGKVSVIHSHVFAAVFIGGAITSLPVLLAWLRPGKQSTRYVMACGQVLWSALLIHLTGGRIETHFHIFGSLAILAFYRDLKVLIPATVVIATDHFARGIYWPESVYGIANPEWWRFLEHAGWVVFIDTFLIMNCVQSYRDLWDLSRQQVELKDSRESMIRMEKLAAVGQLAASVGHELRNPLAAIGNAQTYISRRLGDSDEEPIVIDPKIKQFLDLMKRELNASDKIISNLLEFSRPKNPIKSPCPLHPLVQEALGIVPVRQGVEVLNEVPENWPC